jgi:dTDP-glucose pyrophosphorylase
MKKDWKEITVKPDSTIQETMGVLDQGGAQIVLVMDDECHLAGTVTDGDIRRALLRGQGMEASIADVMNANPVTGLLAEDRDIWQRTMQRHNLRHLPLLDAQGCVADLIRYEMPSEPERTTPVIIMAGGLGTRLRPLTDDLPKPLIKVGSRPVLETIVEGFADQGFKHITLCINYRGEMIRDHFGDGSQWDVHIDYVEEPERLGTAGALTLLPQRINEPCIIMNGDLLTKIDFVRLLDFHNKQNFSATIAMREYSHQIPYGVLEVDDAYKVNRMLEKPVERRYVSAGIYVLDPAALSLIPRGEYFDMPSLFNQLLERGSTVGSFPLRDYWIDIGRLEDLERAGQEFSELFGT